MWRKLTTELRELIHIKLIASIINEINAAFNRINKTMNLGRVNLFKSSSKSLDLRTPINEANILLIHII